MVGGFINKGAELKYQEFKLKLDPSKKSHYAEMAQQFADPTILSPFYAKIQCHEVVYRVLRESNMVADRFRQSHGGRYIGNHLS